MLFTEIQTKQILVDATELPRSSPDFCAVYFEKPSDETDRLKNARKLFDLREYPKAARTLVNDHGQLAIFIRSYTTYLVCQKKIKEEAST